MIKKILNTFIYKKTDVINLLRDYLNLSIQHKSGQLKQSHLLKKIRRKIAIIKHDLSVR